MRMRLATSPHTPAEPASRASTRRRFIVTGSFSSDSTLRRDGDRGMWDTGLGRMRIAVISDLHIGADDFSPTGFGEFLDHLEREHDEIILLGDVFECYFPVLPWRALAEYDRLDRLHRDITHRFRSAKYTILSGNHDMVVRRARGIPSRTERAHNGYRILLSHGHENESAFGSAVKVRLVELYMWLVYRLKRVGLPALYHYSYRMDYELNMKDGGAAHLEAARRPRPAWLRRRRLRSHARGPTRRASRRRHLYQHRRLRPAPDVRLASTSNGVSAGCSNFPGGASRRSGKTNVIRNSAISRRVWPPASRRLDRAPRRPRARWRRSREENRPASPWCVPTWGAGIRS